MGSFILADCYQQVLKKGITLYIAPGVEVSWQQFNEDFPGNSLGCDGFVRGAPKFNHAKVQGNLNHHDEVNRLATRSTSGQVNIGIKQGMLDPFRKKGRLLINIFGNDCDQDMCLTVWQIMNHERISGLKSEPLLNKLLLAEDNLDTTAGSYPYDPTSVLMMELAWIFKPYTDARISGRIRSMQGSEMANVIMSVCTRIDRYTLGNGETEVLDVDFDEIGGGKGWKMIKENGFYARTGLFNRGINAFVSHLGVGEGGHHYTIGKMSTFIDFPIEYLYEVLNKAEGLDPALGISWNGGDTIGGSPRTKQGSKFSPAELEKLINQALKDYRKV